MRSRTYRFRKFCAISGAGRFPAHPICFPAGETGLAEVPEEFRIGREFDVADRDRIINVYDRQMDKWLKDDTFQALLIEACFQTLNMPKSLLKGEFLLDSLTDQQNNKKKRHINILWTHVSQCLRPATATTLNQIFNT